MKEGRFECGNCRTHDVVTLEVFNGSAKLRGDKGEEVGNGGKRVGFEA